MEINHDCINQYSGVKVLKVIEPFKPSKPFVRWHPEKSSKKLKSGIMSSVRILNLKTQIILLMGQKIMTCFLDSM